MSAPSPFRGRLGIARAGHRQLAIACGVAVVWALLGGLLSPWLAAPAIALPVFVAWFFRDPERSIPGARELLLSPADGTVDDLAELEHAPLLDGPGWRIGIYLSLLSVHVQRAPAAGTVLSSTARAGRRVATHRVGETDDNEQHVTVFAPRPGGRPSIAVRQIAGPIACGIVNVLGAGMVVEPGARIGLIRFGSRVELFVSRDALRTLHVERGARVRAGESVLAILGRAANDPLPVSSSSANPVPSLQRSEP